MFVDEDEMMGAEYGGGGHDFGNTHQAGGEGGVRLSEVQGTHTDQVRDLGWRLPRCVRLLGGGGQQEVLSCRATTAREWFHCLNYCCGFISITYPVKIRCNISILSKSKHKKMNPICAAELFFSFFSPINYLTTPQIFLVTLTRPLTHESLD